MQIVGITRPFSRVDWCVHRFTAASDAEAVRSALDDLQQAGLGIREMSMQCCETFADTFIQQLLRQPLSSLTGMRLDLTDAQYSSAEVRPGLARKSAVSLPEVPCLLLSEAYNTRCDASAPASVPEQSASALLCSL
jgi:hypothetical protein